MQNAKFSCIADADLAADEASGREGPRNSGKIAMRSTRSKSSLAAALLGAGLCLGGASHALAQTKVEFPAKPDASELPAVWPEQAGVNSDKLVALSRWIREQKLDVRSLVIVKDGKIAFERYSSGLTRDKNYELYSITKALTAILAGDLIAEGKISLDSSVKDVVGALPAGPQGRRGRQGRRETAQRPQHDDRACTTTSSRRTTRSTMMRRTV